MAILPSNKLQTNKPKKHNRPVPNQGQSKIPTEKRTQLLTTYDNQFDLKAKHVACGTKRKANSTIHARFP